MKTNAVQYIVEGGHRLSGTIRPSGNKNAALPIVAAALVTDQPVILENVPRIRDVETLVELVKSVGASAEWTERNTLHIHAKSLRAADLDPELCKKIRGAILLAAPLLGRCGEIKLPPPGGDVIGRRRLDTHFLALEQLGATYKIGKLLEFRTSGLRGVEMFLDEPSVTATENAITAAVMAKGTTVIGNAACEPHVQDLCHFLVALGARIDGIGTNRVTIEGGRTLTGATHRIGPDHIERAGIEHLRAIRMGFERLGVVCEVEGDDLIVPANQSMEIQSDLGGAVPKLEDQPWPAFPADVMSIAIVTATQCKGMVLMFEKMFESRMFFVDKLVAMGARIVLCDPHRAIVAGPSALTASTVESPDIRAGMAMLLAAMCAKGTSTINNVGQIERGYERIDERLRALGARIERVEDRRER